MAVSVMGNIGAGVRAGTGGDDRGFTDVVPPGMAVSPPSAFASGTTMLGIAAAIWLAVLYVHWKQY